MSRTWFPLLMAAAMVWLSVPGAAAESSKLAPGPIIRLNPPEQGFFTKELLCGGIPIKAPEVVTNAALWEAGRRLSRQLAHLPMVRSNLIAAGVEVHLIGQHQVTSDLPEFRKLKGKPLPEYKGETVDQRTRGLGGRLTSCGEENLLKLPTDHYFGRDILVHEFAHAIRNYGLPREVVARFNQQYQASLAAGLWKGAYAGSNPDEYFAELTMWYFGTHGDLNMTGPKPANGPEGLKNYDPKAFALFDDFYSGRIPISKVEPRHYFHPHRDSDEVTTNDPASDQK
ncbi:MAG TPA: hypothetical protein VFV81_01990 [Verrucomicrobiae bacterium]|nr:hypothetical protein [Verrucomicrobiae bacterium]